MAKIDCADSWKTGREGLLDGIVQAGMNPRGGYKWSNPKTCPGAIDSADKCMS